MRFANHRFFNWYPEDSIIGLILVFKSTFLPRSIPLIQFKIFRCYSALRLRQDWVFPLIMPILFNFNKIFWRSYILKFFQKPIFNSKINKFSFNLMSIDLKALWMITSEILMKFYALEKATRRWKFVDDGRIVWWLAGPPRTHRIPMAWSVLPYLNGLVSILLYLGQSHKDAKSEQGGKGKFRNKIRNKKENYLKKSRKRVDFFAEIF